MLTLAQELQATIVELDSTNADDEAYRARFSTGSKRHLRHGETWRSRLIAWADRETNLN